MGRSQPLRNQVGRLLQHFEPQQCTLQLLISAESEQQVAVVTPCILGCATVVSGSFNYCLFCNFRLELQNLQLTHRAQRAESELADLRSFLSQLLAAAAPSAFSQPAACPPSASPAPAVPTSASQAATTPLATCQAASTPLAACTPWRAAAGAAGQSVTYQQPLALGQTATTLLANCQAASMPPATTEADTTLVATQAAAGKASSMSPAAAAPSNPQAVAFLTAHSHANDSSLAFSQPAALPTAISPSAASPAKVSQAAAAQPSVCTTDATEQTAAAAMTSAAAQHIQSATQQTPLALHISPPAADPFQPQTSSSIIMQGRANGSSPDASTLSHPPLEAEQGPKRMSNNHTQQLPSTSCMLQAIQVSQISPHMHRNAFAVHGAFPLEADAGPTSCSQQPHSTCTVSEADPSIKLQQQDDQLQEQLASPHTNTTALCASSFNTCKQDAPISSTQGAVQQSDSTPRLPAVVDCPAIGVSTSSAAAAAPCIEPASAHVTQEDDVMHLEVSRGLAVLAAAITSRHDTTLMQPAPISSSPEDTRHRHASPLLSAASVMQQAAARVTQMHLTDTPMHTAGQQARAPENARSLVTNAVTHMADIHAESAAQFSSFSLGAGKSPVANADQEETSHSAVDLFCMVADKESQECSSPSLSGQLPRNPVPAFCQGPESVHMPANGFQAMTQTLPQTALPHTASPQRGVAEQHMNTSGHVPGQHAPGHQQDAQTIEVAGPVEAAAMSAGQAAQQINALDKENRPAREPASATGERKSSTASSI